MDQNSDSGWEIQKLKLVKGNTLYEAVTTVNGTEYSKN